MQCNKPLTAYAVPGGSITFNRAESSGREMKIPCGRCWACRLSKSNEWALRATNEMLFHDESSFITLTYDEEHLPENGTLVKEDLQKFFKRFRKKIHPKKIRYLACGEYGEKLSRPHYHAIIFGYGFPDREQISERGKPLWTSQLLADVWGKGFVTVAPATFETARYTAKYITKKITGDLAKSHYAVIKKDTGEIVSHLLSEFLTVSRRPGIGANYFEEFLTDIYPSDYLIHDNVKYGVPRFYDDRLMKIDPDLLKKVKEDRQKRMKKFGKKTEQQMKDSEIILEAKHKDKRKLN